MYRRFLQAVRIAVAAMAIGFAASASDAWANIGLVAGAGGIGGTFTKGDASLPVKGYGFIADLSWHPESRGGKLWPILMGLSMKQAKIGYTENAIKKSGSYNAFGANLGLSMQFSDNFSMRVLAQYYPYASFTTLSTNSVRLNGRNFRYSTYETYSGKPAFEGRVNFTHDKITGGFTKSNRFRSGVGIGFLQQDILAETAEVSTSNDEISPETTLSKSEVEDRMVLFTIDFFIGITF